MSYYIVAGSKPWNRVAFDNIAKNDLAIWRYVSNPEELNLAIDIEMPDYIFFLHWNWRVSEVIWRKNECICFHMTDVPYGRGGSPLQNLILAGKTETVVTALQMVEEMDAGPVYTKMALSLDGRAEEIYVRAGELCWNIIEWMIINRPAPTPQVGEPYYFVRRKPEQSVMPKYGDIRYIYDFIRMLDAPTYPSSFIEHGEYLLEFFNANIIDDKVVANVIFRKK